MRLISCDWWNVTRTISTTAIVTFGFLKKSYTRIQAIITKHIREISIRELINTSNISDILSDIILSIACLKIAMNKFQKVRRILNRTFNQSGPKLRTSEQATDPLSFAIPLGKNCVPAYILHNKI